MLIRWLVVFLIFLPEVLFGQLVTINLPKGSVPGNAYVDRLGGANYSVAIDVPPGAANLQPTLSIDYNQSYPDEWLGTHFRLGGVSKISRCAATMAAHGYRGSIQYDANDRFCLDGVPLVVVSGAYGSDQSEYRTYPDQFTRVVAYGTSGSGPSYFIAYTKDGLVYHYGGDTGSAEGRIFAYNQNSIVRVWSVSRVANRSGAYIDYRYSIDTLNIGYRLSYIDYTGHESPGAIAPSNRLFFSYTPRPQLLRFEGGFPYTMQWSLTSIQAFKLPLGSNPVPIHQHTINYETLYANLNHAPRVKSIKKCAGFSTTNCLKPTTFAYQDPSEVQFQFGLAGSGELGSNFGGMTIATSNILADESNGKFSNLISNSFFYQLFSSSMSISRDFFGDVNGDSRADIISVSSSGDATVWLATKGGTFSSSSVWGTGLTSAQFVKLGDVNGDGLADLFVFRSNGFVDVYKSTGTGLVNDFAYHTPSVGPLSEKPALADVNGDGRTDIIKFGPNGGATVWLATGSGFASPVDWIPASYSAFVGFGGNVPYLGDFNGDGAADIVESRVGGSFTYWISNRTNAFVPSAQTVATGLPFNPFNSGRLPYFFGDFNGDGLKDVLALGITGAKVYISDGVNLVYDSSFDLGSSFSATVLGEGAFFRVADFNGDGKADICNYQYVGFSTTSVQVRLSNGAGFEPAWNVGFGYQNLTSPSQIVPPWTPDLDGDGRSDLVLPSVGQSNGTLYGFISAQNTPYPDLVTSVLDGNGYGTGFNYLPLSNSSVYTDTISASYVGNDYQPFRFPLYVASAHYWPNGLGKTSGFQYRYSGAMYNHNFGFIGFENQSKTPLGSSPPLPRIDSTSYTIPFPYLGQTETIRTDFKLPIGVWKTKEFYRNYWSSQTSGANVPYAHLDSYDQKTYNTAAGAVLRDHKTVSFISPDGFGNPATILEVSPLDLSTATTNLTYLNDPNSWIIGLKLTLSSNRNRQNQGAVVRNFIYTYFPGTTLLNTVSQSWPDYGASTTSTRSLSYQYDSFGNPTVETQSGTGVQSRTTLVSYDSSGTRPMQKTNSLGQVTLVNFELNYGKLRSIADPNGITTQWFYDSLGRFTHEIGPDNVRTDYYDDPLLPFTFSVFGRPPVPTNAVRVVGTQTQGGPMKQAFYDIRNRLVQTVEDSVNGKYVVTDIRYNGRDLVRQISEPYIYGDTPSWNSFNYDYADNLIGKTLPNGSTYTIDTVPNTPISSNAVTAGQLIAYQEKVTDPLGRRKVTFYDTFGDPIQVQDRDPNDVLVGAQSFRRNGIGQITDSMDISSNTISAIYDAAGRKVVHSEADLGTQSYSYSSLDELTSITPAVGIPTTFQYDLLGRLVSKVAVEGNTTWTYDTSSPAGIGKLSSVATSYSSLPNSSYIYAYDNLGRQNSVTGILNQISFSENTTYDNRGRVATRLYSGSMWPGNLQLNYGYTTTGYLETIAKVTGASTTTEIWRLLGLDPYGRVQRERFGDGRISERGLDPDGNIISIRHLNGTATPYNDLVYQYDNLGRVTHRSDLSLSSVVEESDYNEWLLRLARTRVCHPQSGGTCYGWVSQFFNGIGNITANSLFGPLLYNLFGAGPHAVASISPENYFYNANGELHSKNPSSGSVTAFAWSSFGKPSVINTTSTPPVTEQVYYNAFGERFFDRFTDASGLKQTYYLGDDVEHQILPSGATKNILYVYAYGRPVAIHNLPSSGSTTIHYIRTDLFNSPTTITNFNGTVIERYSYDAYGRARNPSTWSAIGATNNYGLSRGFNWQRKYAQFDLVEMGHRLYNPTLGRFMNPDPTIPDERNTQAFNRYSYAYNDPFHFVDPSGYTPEPIQLQEVTVTAEGNRCLDCVQLPSLPFIPPQTNLSTFNSITPKLDQPPLSQSISTQIKPVTKGTVEQNRNMRAASFEQYKRMTEGGGRLDGVFVESLFSAPLSAVSGIFNFLESSFNILSRDFSATDVLNVATGIYGIRTNLKSTENLLGRPGGRFNSGPEIISGWANDNILNPLLSNYKFDIRGHANSFPGRGRVDRSSLSVPDATSVVRNYQSSKPPSLSWRSAVRLGAVGGY